MKNYAMSSVSLAHTYGNMTSYFVEYVKNLFPKDYFKTVHVSSKIAYREFNIFQNTNKEFIKKGKPMLIIRPRVELDNPDTFLRGTYLTTRITDGFMDVENNNLQPFIYDKDTGVEIKYLMNRLRMVFDVSIIVETQMEQINKANYLKNRVMVDRPFMMPVNLESNVESIFFQSLASEANIPLYGEDGSVKEFLDYANGVSMFPITYKLKNSTGCDEFFRFYRTNVDTVITDLAMDEGSKRGFVDGSYAISFSIETEFYAAGMYYYFTRNRQVIDAIDMNIVSEDSGQLIPIFTFQHNVTETIPQGWDLYSIPMFKVEKRPDILELDPIFNDSIKYVLEYHRKHGIDSRVFLKFSIMKDNDTLIEGKDYVIDYDKMILTTYNTNKYSTYRMLIYANISYSNSLISRLTGFEEER